MRVSPRRNFAGSIGEVALHSKYVNQNEADMAGQTKSAVDWRSFDSSAIANTSRFLLCLLCFLCVFIGCSKGRQSIAPATVRKVTVGIQVSPAMTLLMVAKDEGFFLRQGLDVELKEFTAGKFALQAFLGGSI